jgi:hypothetical protein
MNYRITSALLIADPIALAFAVFPAGGWTRLESSQDYVLVTFASPQTPADLGPLVKVEALSN